MLYQPTFVTPSDLVYGNNIFFALEDDQEFSWKVNGNSALYAWKIECYALSNGSYVKIRDSGIKTYGCPFSGHTVPSNVSESEDEMFVVPISEVTDISTEEYLTTDENNKIYFKIWQWYNNHVNYPNDFIVSPMYSATLTGKMYLVEMYPQVVTTVTERSATFGAILNASIGGSPFSIYYPITFDSYRFMISDSSDLNYGNIYDTGFVYGIYSYPSSVSEGYIQVAKAEYDGFINGNTYYYKFILTKEGNYFDYPWQDVTVSYSTATSQYYGAEVQCVAESNSSAVLVDFSEYGDYGIDTTVPSHSFSRIAKPETVGRTQATPAMGLEIESNYISWNSTSSKVDFISTAGVTVYVEYGFIFQKKQSETISIFVGTAEFRFGSNNVLTIYYQNRSYQTVTYCSSNNFDKTIIFYADNDGTAGVATYWYDNDGVIHSYCVGDIDSHLTGTNIRTQLTSTAQTSGFIKVSGNDTKLAFAAICQRTSANDRILTFMSNHFVPGYYPAFSFSEEVFDYWKNRATNSYINRASSATGKSEFVAFYLGGTSMLFNGFGSTSSTSADVYRVDISTGIASKITSSLKAYERTVLDYSLLSNTPVEYFVVPYSFDRMYSESLMSNEISLRLKNWYLIEAEKQEDGTYELVREFIFANNVVSGSIGNNNAPTISDTFTGYPLVQKSIMNYKGGTLESLIGAVERVTVNGMTTERYSDTIETRDALMKLSKTDNHLFLKNRKGDLFKVRISGAITSTTNDASVEQTQTISIPWVEVGSSEGVGIYQHVSDTITV